ncbi:fam-l protein [Plasmodium malariae]|uniref:Fam-l protein n=1 Tax=Plasmodium malariae TaxID=5858 RepID=A0A1D3JHY6_PLAMA|nr:fam-l protein [Plasmodium malariae]SBT85884.1 fam-l protein [Plasmodium malariae]
MEQNLKSIIFFKICAFVLLTWICHHNSDMITSNKPLKEKCKFHKKINTRNYRLLAKHKHDNDSLITGLKENVPNNKVPKRKDISHNENIRTGKKELLNTCSSSSTVADKKAIKNKSRIFETKKYSHLEKKIFKELDYENFLKNNRSISDKTYKNIIIKKYGLRLALPVLLFLILFIVFIINFSLGFSTTKVSWDSGLFGLSDYIKNFEVGNSWLSEVLKWLKNNTSGLWLHYGTTKDTSSTLCNLCKEATGEGVKLSEKCILGQLFGYIFYFVPFIILGVTFISWIIYYHKKVKKYQKIKLRKR